MVGRKGADFHISELLSLQILLKSHLGTKLCCKFTHECCYAMGKTRGGGRALGLRIRRTDRRVKTKASAQDLFTRTFKFFVSIASLFVFQTICTRVNQTWTSTYTNAYPVCRVLLQPGALATSTRTVNI